MSVGSVQSVCVSKKKGVAKDAVNEARVLEEHGIQGDAHAGSWHRQISLLTARDVDQMRAKGLDLAPGAFGENFVVDGIELDELGIGSRLRVSECCELEVTQLGKVCHTRCAIYHKTGDCIMPRLGVFARVLRGGTVRTGDSIQAVFTVERSVVQVAIVGVVGKDADAELEGAIEGILDRVGAIENCRVAYVASSEGDDTIGALLRDLVGRPVDLVVSIHAATAHRSWLTDLRGVVPIRDGSWGKGRATRAQEERGPIVFRLRGSLLLALPCDVDRADTSIRLAAAYVNQWRGQIRTQEQAITQPLRVLAS